MLQVIKGAREYPSHSSVAALNNLIATVVEMEDPYEKFSEGIRNFHKHYCEDDHNSDWCCHDKVSVYQTIACLM